MSDEVTISASGGITYTPHQIVFTKLVPAAKLPMYMTTHAAGADLFSAEETVLYSGAVKIIGTGLSGAIPKGYEVQVRPRSGLAAKNGITVLNAPGTIDADYSLEWKVILINHGRSDVLIHVGDAIAQMVVAPVTQLNIAELHDNQLFIRASVADTIRTGGFGSTS